MSEHATGWTPTPNQAAVLEAAQEPGLKRSIVAICRAAGVDRSRLYAWLAEDADFRAAWEGLWQVSLKRHLPGIVAAQVDKAQKGDTAAARLLLDLAGMLTQKHKISGDAEHPLAVALTVTVVDDRA